LIKFQLIDQILVTALQIKACNDWQNSFERLNSIQNEIIENKNSTFRQTLLEAKKNWNDYPFVKKFDVLSLLSEKICSLYGTETVHIHDREGWIKYSSPLYHYIPMFSDFTWMANGVYYNFEYGPLKSLNVIFPNTNFNENADFFEFIKVFAHELAHSIIDDRHRTLKKSLKKHEQTWNDETKILENPKLDPVETVALLKLYENKKKFMRERRISVCENLENKTTLEDDGDLIKVTDVDEEAKTEYCMLWEERCAESFGQYVVTILKNALTTAEG